MHEYLNMETQNNDEAIDIEIEKELNALTEEDLVNLGDDEDCPETVEDTTNNEEEVSESMLQYMKYVQEQEQRWKEEMQECDQILSHTEIALTTPRSVRLDKDTCAEHTNPDQLTNEVLNELEQQEERDRQRVLDEAASILQGNNTETSDVNSNQLIENKGMHSLEMECTEKIGLKEAPLSNGQGDGEEEITLQPEEGVVAVLLDSDTLERNMYEQIRDWEERRAQLEEKRQMEMEERKVDEYRKTEEEEFKRKEIQQQLNEEQEKIKLLQLDQEERMKAEAKKISDKLEESFREQEEVLERLDNEVKQEKEQFEIQKLEREKLLEEQREAAATRLQAAFRSLRVRLEIGGVLKKKAEQRKIVRETERIQAVENQRKEAEEQKAEEERKKNEAEEEEKRRKEEEIKRKMEEQERIKRQEEEEKIQREEEKKQREEEILRKKEEERIKKEEIERKRKEKEELKRQQDEERKQLKEEEKKRKQEEEQKRKDEAELKKQREEEMKKQKEEEERKKKEDEARRKAEEELQRKQEEERRIKEEEMTRKKEEEKQRQIEEEAARKAQEEIERKKREEEENTRKIESEKRKKKDIEEKNRAAIQRMQASLSTSVSSDKLLLPPKSLDLGSMEKLIDEHRMAWMKQCKPWSQSTSEQKCRNLPQGNKRLPRRPSSSKDLQPLSESVVLQLSNAASLQQVTTVEITDLPGCRGVNVLSQCPNLQHLTINNCRLAVLEGLQACSKLLYLDAKNNNIELVDLRQMPSLVYLDLSQNKLTSIHGLEGCSGIRHLSLTRNNISRIGGLASLQSLHTLDVSHNQLISCQGLHEVLTIQRLDLSHNHLPALEDIKHLGLLQFVDASNNNIMQIPDLKNQILLRELIFNNNSISAIQNMSTLWLPLLRRLSLSQNSLREVNELPGCVLLQTLDISNNQILEQDALLRGLSAMYNLQHLTLTGNPVTSEPSTERCVHHYVKSLHTLNGEKLENPSVEKMADFQKMCMRQLESHDSLQEAFSQAYSKKPASKRGQLFELYHTQSCVLTTEHRFVHEYGTISLDYSEIQPNFDLATEEDTPVNKPVTEARSKFETALVQSSQIKADSKAQFEQNLKVSVEAKSKFDSCLQSQTMKTDAKAKFEAAFEVRPKLNEGTAPLQTSVPASLVGQILEQPTKRHHSAATKIQALWRGYILRKRLQMALDYARFEEQSDDDDDFFNDEIDMSAFNFNENELDDDWKCPATPQLPSHHPILGSNNAQMVKHNTGVHQPHPPGHPRQAWRNSESPMMPHFPSGKPPLPPVSPSVGAETHRTMDTNKTKKSEKLTEEWGFKDSRTAELMMQRARKLKYNSQRKKKISQLDPRQKLALFRKLEESKNLRPIQPPPRKGATRKEYFHAKEEEEHYKAQNKITEQTTRGSRTYEWVHEQVARYEPETSPTRHGITRTFSSEGSLPHIDRNVLSGGRTNLTGSPVSIELESVSSFAHSRSTNRRHSSTEASAIQLPQIKTNSAPSAHQKERMSFRNPVVNQSVGWGGGKKRGKRF